MENCFWKKNKNTLKPKNLSRSHTLTHSVYVYAYVLWVDGCHKILPQNRVYQKHFLFLFFIFRKQKTKQSYQTYFRVFVFFFFKTKQSYQTHFLFSFFLNEHKNFQHKNWKTKIEKQNGYQTQPWQLISFKLNRCLWRVVHFP